VCDLFDEKYFSSTQFILYLDNVKPALWLSALVVGCKFTVVLKHPNSGGKRTMILNRLRLLGSIVLGAALVTATSGLQAQSMPAKASTSDYDSRWDFSALYSYLGVHGSDKTDQVGGTIPTAGASISSFSFSSVNLGAYGSGAYYFDKHFGLEGAFADHQIGTNDGFNSLEVGPIYRYRQDHVTYFAHALVGGVDAAGPNQDSPNSYHNPWTWGFGLTFGGGMDYAVPKYKFLSIRVFQADLVYDKVNFGPSSWTSLSNANPLGGRANLASAQLSSGLVLHFGSIAPPPAVTYSCSATPSTVFPGDPVTVTGTASNLEPKKTATYTWTSTSGPVTGSGSTVTVSSKTAGSYTVSGKVSDGEKAYEMASCTASFTVKDYDPPTVSCSANPSTVNPGESSTITTVATSPQNRPLTYSYSTSAGSISGSGTTATLSTTGAPSGTATVTCNAVDDTGKSASATTTVSILAPPPPPAPMAKSLCTVSFERDKNRPVRVDNEAKACLDDITLSLQQDPSSKLELVGNVTAKEAKRKLTEKYATERAENTKEYLVKDKGIDGSRIMLYTGTADAKTVTTTIVPSGATANTTGLTPVPEMMKKPMSKKHKMK